MSFDSYAKNWDTDIRIKRAKTIADEIGKTITCNNNYTAMEFGCGTGLISFNLIDRFKSIILVDSSKGMIDILNDKITKYNISNMQTFQIDIVANTKIDNKYDVIYNSMVLHHIIDTKDIIKQFYELLNDNGELCIVDLNEEDGRFHKKYPKFDGHNGFSQTELKEVLTSIGFKDIKTRTFYHGEKIIEGEKINYSLFIMKARKH